MIIGLTGKARSGKDTVAEHLAIAHSFNHYWFSKPMKDACRDIFGWSDDHLYGDLKEIKDENFGVSPRVALQTLGTEWGRNCIAKDLWIRRAKVEMQKCENIVISDCRFDNEAQCILDMGGYVIEVIRDAREEVEAHSSESGISENLISFTIENNGTLTDLYRVVDCLLISKEGYTYCLDWPDDKRIDAIGQNGNDGLHYKAIKAGLYDT